MNTDKIIRQTLFITDEPNYIQFKEFPYKLIINNTKSYCPQLKIQSFMNSQNVEMAKKIVKSSFLTIGGLWVSYVAYHTFPIFYVFRKFYTFKPTNEMLEKAWEGFDYNPEINTLKTVHQVFKRSAILQKEIMLEYTITTKNYRQANKLETLDKYISTVKYEIDQKLYQTRMSIMHFLKYKNYSFEEFYQKNFVEQNDQFIMQMIVEYDIQQFICYDPNKDRLPTINQCIDYLKIIIPFIIQMKPQFDRLRHMIVQNRFDQFRYMFCITYLSDLIESVLNINFQSLQTALRLINFQKIKPNQRGEAQKLWEDYKQLCLSIVE